MFRSQPRPTPVVVLALILVLSACTGTSHGNTPPSSNPLPSAQQASASPTASRPLDTAPPVDKKLVDEALAVNRAAFEASLAVAKRGGFPANLPEKRYSLYLMGDALAEETNEAINWHEDKLRPDAKSTLALSHVRALPVARATSLIALEMCWDRSKLVLWSSDETYSVFSKLRLVRYFTRDRDGRLKIFQQMSQKVDACGQKAPSAADIATGTKLMHRAWAIERKYRLAGGIDWARQKTPDLDEVLGNPALRSQRQHLGTQRTDGWQLQGPNAHSWGTWVTPFAIKGSDFALSLCLDKRQQVYTYHDGTAGQGSLSLYTAWFTRQDNGELRITSYSQFRVHACG